MAKYWIAEAVAGRRDEGSPALADEPGFDDEHEAIARAKEIRATGRYQIEVLTEDYGYRIWPEHGSEEEREMLHEDAVAKLHER